MGSNLSLVGTTGGPIRNACKLCKLNKVSNRQNNCKARKFININESRSTTSSLGRPLWWVFHLETTKSQLLVHQMKPKHKQSAKSARQPIWLFKWTILVDLQKNALCFFLSILKTLSIGSVHILHHFNIQRQSV